VGYVKVPRKKLQILNDFYAPFLEAQSERINNELRKLHKHRQGLLTPAWKADKTLGRALDKEARRMSEEIVRLRQEEGICEVCGIRKVRRTKTGKRLKECSQCRHIDVVKSEYNYMHRIMSILNKKGE
jgi:ribosomal protein L37AE/L43A